MSEQYADDTLDNPLLYALPETEEERIDQSQGIRQLGIGSVTRNGTYIPTDKDEREFLLKLLDGKDKQSVARLRLNVDKDKNASDSELAKEFARLSAGVRGVQTPVAPTPGYVPPAFEEGRLPQVQVVPGQLDTGTHNLTFADLEATHGRKDKPA